MVVRFASFGRPPWHDAGDSSASHCMALFTITSCGELGSETEGWGGGGVENEGESERDCLIVTWYLKPSQPRRSYERVRGHTSVVGRNIFHWLTFRSNSLTLCLRYTSHVFQITWKMKSNEPRRQKLERQNSWQMAEYTKLYSDLLQT